MGDFVGSPLYFLVGGLLLLLPIVLVVIILRVVRAGDKRQSRARRDNRDVDGDARPRQSRREDRRRSDG